MQRYDVHISLAEYQAVRFCILCHVERKQVLSLFENKVFRRVQVFCGVVCVHGSAAEAYNVAAVVDYRKHTAASESVKMLAARF